MKLEKVICCVKLENRIREGKMKKILMLLDKGTEDPEFVYQYFRF